MNNLIVSKSNLLIEASYQLNTNAQKLILCCVSKLDSRVGAVTNKEMTISTAEYENMTGVSNARRELYKAADSLFNSSITIYNDKEDIKLHWIQKAVNKHKGDGAITIKWTEDVLEYLTQLEVRFTSYKLANITNLNSAHAIRLYELLIKWKSTGELVIFVEDFKHILGISDKYNEYRSLNQWVIQPCLKELKKSDLDITFIPIKKGRKVEALGFQFKQKKLPTIKTPKPKPKPKLKLNQSITISNMKLESYDYSRLNLNKIKEDLQSRGEKDLEVILREHINQIKEDMAIESKE